MTWLGTGNSDDQLRNDLVSPDLQGLSLVRASSCK